MRRMWHIWPGQLWPMLPEQESAFVSELKGQCSSAAKFDRDDVTAVLGILRCGAPLSRALALAPGLNLRRLLGAYQCLSSRLEESAAAWQRIVSDPSPAVLFDSADQAARLLPVPVHRALYAMEESESVLATVVADLAAQVDFRRQTAMVLEEELRAHVPPSLAGVAIGASLHSPSEPGLYADPFYFPDRVAALSSVRVMDLLGEPRG